MMKPWEVIEQLDATPSRTNKEAILLSEAKANNDELFAGFMLNDSNMKNIGQKSGTYLYENGYGAGNQSSDYRGVRPLPQNSYKQPGARKHLLQIYIWPSV